MEGEDPVAVLSDLELLLRLTEPARSATALCGYCEPALHRITLAGAGPSPPLQPLRLAGSAFTIGPGDAAAGAAPLQQRRRQHLNTLP